MSELHKATLPGNTQIMFREGGPGLFNLQGMNMPGLKSKRTVIVPNRHANLPAGGTIGVSRWGNNNMYPQDVIKDIKGAPYLLNLFKFTVGAHFGKGLLTYLKKIEDGKINITPVEDAEFEAFRKINNLDREYLKIVKDHEWLRNRFAEIHLTADSYRKKKRIARFFRLEASKCRFEIREKGPSEHIFYSANWPNPLDGEYAKIPLLDPNDPYEDLMSRTEADGYKFALSNPSFDLDTDYYDRTLWDGLRDDGWLEIAKNVPKLKLAIMRNSVMIKYLIYIPASYWVARFDGWDTKDDKEKETLINAKVDEINKYLADIDNWGKSMILQYDDIRSSNNGKTDYAKIEIKPLDQPIKDNIYLPDSQQANQEIAAAFGVDQALTGVDAPGSERSGGSGSNKREGYTIFQAQKHMDREDTLWFIRFIDRVNEYPVEIGIMNNDISETLDKNPTGQKTTV